MSPKSSTLSEDGRYLDFLFIRREAKKGTNVKPIFMV